MDVFDIVDAVLKEHKTNPIKSQCTYSAIKREAIFAYCAFLTGMAGDSGGDIAEIGTDVGMSALSLAYGASLINNAPVYSFDIRPESLEFTKKVADKLSIKNLSLELGTSYDVKKFVKPNGLGIGYIDGEHDFKWCFTDLNNLYPLIAPFGKILLHDFPTPLSGWEERIHHNGVGHACLKFSELHPEISFSYLGASWLCGSIHHPKAWNVVLARKTLLPLM